MVTSSTWQRDPISSVWPVNPGSERHAIDPFARIDQPFAISGQHFDVGKQVVRKKDRLRSLEMRVARKDCVAILCSELNQGALESGDPAA